MDFKCALPAAFLITRSAACLEYIHVSSRSSNVSETPNSEWEPEETSGDPEELLGDERRDCDRMVVDPTFAETTQLRGDCAARGRSPDILVRFFSRKYTKNFHADGALGAQELKSDVWECFSRYNLAGFILWSNSILRL